MDRQTVLKEIQKLINALSRTLTEDELKTKIKKYVKEQYNKGIDDAESYFGVNFVRNDEDLKFLNNYVDTKVSEVTDDISKDMKDVINRALMDDADTQELKRRVREEFNNKKYMDRYKMIIRTEGLRANNKASLESAKQLSFKVKKYLDVTVDDRTSDICMEEYFKYGDKSQAIDLDENFVVVVGNKTYEAMNPPFHPNCFLSDTDIITDKGCKKIKDIQTGDFVKTHKNRFKEVYATMNRQTNEYYEIETSKGVLKVTGEHPVMTNNGWKLVKDLTTKDWVLYTND